MFTHYDRLGLASDTRRILAMTEPLDDDMLADLVMVAGECCARADFGEHEAWAALKLNLVLFRDNPGDPRRPNYRDRAIAITGEIVNRLAPLVEAMRSTRRTA